MISYEKAKELKGKGFPQPNLEEDYDGYFSCGCDDLYNTGKDTEALHSTLNCENERCYKPTLFELIEACGDRFWLVERLESGYGWVANEYNTAHHRKNGILPEQGRGDTPELAVANLWLAINNNIKK